jgi:hypothetical protein
VKKILSHHDFLIIRDLTEPINSQEIEYINAELNEASALDSVKNFLSKNLLGDFSRINILDNIRKSDLAIKKELIEAKGKISDDLDFLGLKLDKIKKSGERGAIIQAENEMERKKNEYSSLVKLKKTQMEQGAKLAEKTIGNNQRRKDYYEAGLAEDAAELARFEYDFAKKRSEDADELKKLEKKLTSAESKADELVNRFKSQANKNKELNIDTKDLSNLQELRKIIKENDPDTIVKLKKKTEVRSEELKEQLKNYLKELLKKMKEARSKGVSYRQSSFNEDLKKIYGFSEEIDSCNNLIDVYTSMGNSRKEISGKIKDQPSLAELFKKINNAVSDNKNLTSEMLLLEIYPVPEIQQVESAIKKIK